MLFRLIRHSKLLTIGFTLTTLPMSALALSFTTIQVPGAIQTNAIGVNASLRLVDPAQYQLRVQDFDFDIIGVAVMLIFFVRQAIREWKGKGGDDQ